MRRNRRTTGCDDLPLSFLCAGSAAFLLSLAHVHPGLWFVSAFALVPLLWRVFRTDWGETLLLGVILAASYVFVTSAGEILTAPLGLVFKFAWLAALFSGFGVAVNLSKRRIGFNPIWIAALWLPFEYALAHYSGLGDLFAFTYGGSSALLRYASLFGFLMISFAIVLLNTLAAMALLALDHVSRHDLSLFDFGLGSDHSAAIAAAEMAPRRAYYLLPLVRAPPCPA